jgi:hypothetical protein
MKFSLIFFMFLMSFVSCSFFEKKSSEKIIAKVNNLLLYESDLVKHIPSNLSYKDSVIFTSQFIDNWATKQLLKQRALLNLDKSKIEIFEKMANDYKLDLYSNAYLNALITKKMDTVVSNNELDTLYKYSKQNYKLNEELLKYRYISLEKNYKDLQSIKSKFKRFSFDDKTTLDSLSFQFTSFSLNDSVWFKKTMLIKNLPGLQIGNNIELLKKPNFIQFEDSIRVYLVQINDLLKRYDQAPKQYVQKTLKQIILNKRKLRLIKQLEIDVRKDAIQNKEYQIYN